MSNFLSFYSYQFNFKRPSLRFLFFLNLHVSMYVHMKFYMHINLNKCTCCLLSLHFFKPLGKVVIFKFFLMFLTIFTSILSIFPPSYNFSLPSSRFHTCPYNQILLFCMCLKFPIPNSPYSLSFFQVNCGITVFLYCLYFLDLINIFYFSFSRS